MPNKIIFDHEEIKRRKNTPDLSGKQLLCLGMENIEDENKILHQILAASSDPILITTKDVKIIFANPAWEKLTGYTLEEVRGKNPKLMQSGKTPKSIYKKLWKALLKKQSFSCEEVINKRKDGSTYQIHCSIFPVIIDGEVTHYVQIQYDITKKKRLDKLKSEFLSVVSHELKTPITVLKLFTQSKLATSQKTNTATLTTKELDLFNREFTRLTNLINDMLDNARIETGKMRMRFEPFNLTELTQETIEKISVIAKNYTFVFEETQSCIVCADKQRIEQVLLNLLSNAIKYSPKESTIEIRLAKNNSHVVISIKDEGVGIPKKERKTIFDKFYQVRRQDGFGLGLYISKEIIKRHKGKIWVEAKSEKGSAFFFTLPLVHSQQLKI